jgi:chloramphenicol O-acetyltransferase type A
MSNFEQRRDRFEFFKNFQNPLLNVTFQQELVNFMPYCRSQNYPVFHFFLYCLMKSLNRQEAFKYRIVEGEVVKGEVLHGSYTVLNQERLFNYTRFEWKENLKDFIQHSLEVRNRAMKTQALLNVGDDADPDPLKSYVFITSLPWLDFTSIQHPVGNYQSADVPCIAWGKFKEDGEKIFLPLSIQVHHGLADGLHISEFSQDLFRTVKEQIEME